MHICVIRSDMSVVGGGERVAANLSNELGEYHKVYGISIFKRNTQWAFELSEGEGWFHIVPGPKAFAGGVMLRVIQGLRRFYRRNKIDVVISTGVGLNFVLALSSLGTNVKFIYSEQSCFQNKSSYAFRGRINRIVGVMFAWKVVLLTQRDKEIFAKQYKRFREKMIHIPNFIEDKLLERKSTHYNVSSKKILTVGRFDRVKGYEMLVEVADSVLSQHSDWEWHIYGGGDSLYFAEIQSLVNLKGLENRLILQGECADIYERYHEYGLFVLTSYYEGFSMVLLEARVNLLPTVSFDCPTGPREIIAHNKSGYLVPCYDISSMAEKIAYLIENKLVRKEFSAYALNDLEQFQKDAVIKKWRMLIEENVMA